MNKTRADSPERSPRLLLCAISKAVFSFSILKGELYDCSYAFGSCMTVHLRWLIKGRSVRILHCKNYGV